MTEHLPECPNHCINVPADYVERDVYMRRCICEKLRACEERVIDAAQEAVAALTKWPDSVEPDNLSFLNYCHGIRDARSAIDALKEKQ